MIYLDYNASVPLKKCARTAFLSALELEGNASSPHGSGRHLRSLVDGARKEILESIKGGRLVFTSGGTEANALALAGFGPISVVVSSIEHDSVLKAVPNPHLIPVTAEGVVDLAAFEKMLSSFKTPGLVSILLVNNETGIIQPVEEAASIAHKKGWKIHTDASQALGRIPFSFESLAVDLMTLSSHKCGGPVGVGALILKENIDLQPLIRGGGQEYGMRSGTLSAPLIMGFTAALKEALQEEGLMAPRLKKFQQKIEAALPSAIIYGQTAPRVSQTLCLGMPNVPFELQLMAFDLKGIAVSAGSACSSGKMKESHVLAAMGVAPQESRCAIRVSMGWKTCEDDIEAFILAWHQIYDQQRLKEVS